MNEKIISYNHHLTTLESNALMSHLLLLPTQNHLKMTIFTSKETKKERELGPANIADIAKVSFSITETKLV